MPTPAHPRAAAPATIRPLAASDLDAVVAIDAAAQGRTRRDYVERRLRAAQREPALHAQFGATVGGRLVGCMLGRVLAGEFGRRQRALRLEMMGVDREHRGGGVGHQLFEALAAWARRHGCTEIRSVARWRDTAILGWFDSLGLELAPDQIVECGVAGGAQRSGRDEPVDANAGASREIDYGGREANDHERLARGAADLRSMTPADLDAIVRIDRDITGRDRREYITARLAEAMDDSALRVSFTACCDDTPVGYLMARADLGDFGRTEPVAVLDTIGVDPEYAHRGVGRALLAQLFANLGALRVERVETVVPHDDLALLGFLQGAGFAPGDRLSFVRTLEGA